MVSEHVKKKKFAKQRWEDLSTCWSVFNETIIPLRRVGCEMIIVNLALQAWLAIYHLISNESLWNNCLIYLPFFLIICTVLILGARYGGRVHFGREYYCVKSACIFSSPLPIHLHGTDNENVFTINISFRY